LVRNFSEVQYKTSSRQRQSQDSFSFCVETIFGEAKICYPISPNQSPNQERRNRQESFLTHPCSVQKTLICFANYKKASHYALSSILVAHNNFPPFPPNPVSFSTV
jgi:hypothetical protein